MKRLILSALFAVTSASLAQSGGGIPLANIGDTYKWIAPEETYRIVVNSSSQPVNLDVYSPSLNLDDYVNGRASAGYYGDEIYGQNLPFSTVFELTGPNGKIISKKYSTSKQHTLERLWASPLPVGTYYLKVKSSGKGKNAYTLRVAAPFSLEASTFTVNARGKFNDDLLAAKLLIPSELQGKQLKLTNYDGDGSNELELVADKPNGSRQTLSISGNGVANADYININSDNVGEWTIYSRIQPGTKQYSNAFAFRLEVDDKPFFGILPPFQDPEGARLVQPIAVEVVDTEGNPIPDSSFTLLDGCASPKLPSGWIPVSAKVLTGKGTVSNSTNACATAPAKIQFVAMPKQGGLRVETVAIVGGERFPITGLPAVVSGQTLKTPFQLSLDPGEYPVTATQLPGATTENKSGTVVNGKINTVVIEYRPQVALRLITNPDAVLACENIDVRALAITEFPYSIPVELSVLLPEGVSSASSAKIAGQLSSNSSVSLSLPSKVCKGGDVQASLSPFNLKTDNTLVVRTSSMTVSQISSTHGISVRKTLGFDGKDYNVSLAISLDRSVQNLRIGDPLPNAGNPAVRGPVTIKQGQGATTPITLEGDTLVLGKLTAGSYTVNYKLFTDLPPAQALTEVLISWDE